MCVFSCLDQSCLSWNALEQCVHTWRPLWLDLSWTLSLWRFRLTAAVNFEPHSSHLKEEGGLHDCLMPDLSSGPEMKTNVRGTIIFYFQVRFFSKTIKLDGKFENSRTTLARPIQIRAFHSNENCLFCTYPLSVTYLFWWKERGKQEALIWMKNYHLNRTLLQ